MTTRYTHDHSQSMQEMVMDEQPEWINTKEAMIILQVNSTQAVRYLMEQYPDKLPGMNVGSEEQPRWVLRRSDVERFQAERSDEL